MKFIFAALLLSQTAFAGFTGNWNGKMATTLRNSDGSQAKDVSHTCYMHLEIEQDDDALEIPEDSVYCDGTPMFYPGTYEIDGTELSFFGKNVGTISPTEINISMVDENGWQHVVTLKKRQGGRRAEFYAAWIAPPGPNGFIFEASGTLKKRKH